VQEAEPSPERLLAVLHRWRDEAVRVGGNITRIAPAFEAGRDDVWLARWLAACGVVLNHYWVIRLGLVKVKSSTKHRNRTRVIGRRMA